MPPRERDLVIIGPQKYATALVIGRSLLVESAQESSTYTHGFDNDRDKHRTGGERSFVRGSRFFAGWGALGYLFTLAE